MASHEEHKSDGTKATAVVSSSQGQSCRLLELPPELRNIIYTYAMPDTKYTYITKLRYKEPILLSTCKQIREEDGPIFYSRNFFLDVSTFDTPPPQPHHWLQSKTSTIKLSISHDRWPKFSAFKPWLKFCHKHNLESVEIWNAWEGHSRPLERMFDVVISLRVLPWSMAERVIDVTKDCINVTAHEGQEFTYEAS